MKIRSFTLSSVLALTVSLFSCQQPSPGMVESPVFSPAGGTFTDPQSVSISTPTADAAIYYTLDGSDPVVSGIAYNSSLNIDSTTTIPAVAVKAGMTDSEITTGVFTIHILYTGSIDYQTTGWSNVIPNDMSSM